MKPKGFTIVEIIIVVVMLGIMVTIAIPKIVGPNDRIMASEGQHTLTVLLSAQKRYKLESASNVYTATLTDLDVTIPSSRYFGVPSLSTTTTELATVVATGNQYTLKIAEDGIIYCTTGTITCASIKCNKGVGTNQCNQ